MSRLAVALVAALVLAGCGGGSGEPPPQGFAAEAPSGWKDGTYAAEQQRDADYEVVYQGPEHEGVPAAINVQRSETSETPDLQQEAERLRAKSEKELGGRPTAATLEKLGGDVALRFDHRVGKVETRRIAAVRKGALYVITLQSHRDKFRTSLTKLAEVVESWRWKK